MLIIGAQPAAASGYGRGPHAAAGFAAVMRQLQPVDARAAWGQLRTFQWQLRSETFWSWIRVGPEEPPQKEYFT